MLRRAPRSPLRRCRRGRSSSRRRVRPWGAGAGSGVAGGRRGGVGGGVGVAQQQLEEGDEVVAIPLAGGVRLAEPELAARGEPTEERRVVDREGPRSAGAEAPHPAVRKLDLEGAALEPRERPLEHARGSALERAAAQRRRLRADAHVRTLPCPGTNGGLRWNGTRFSQSRSAWKWISAVTCSGWSG